MTRSVFLVVAALGALATGCSSSSNSGGPTPQPDAGGDDGGSMCNDTGEHPAARSEMFGVLDAKRSRLVFFGGDTGVPKQCNPAPAPNGELWTYDFKCQSFSKVDFTDGPGGRTRGASIYDPDGDRMIIFGGRYRKATAGTYTVYNEVWALDLSTLAWSQIMTTGTPPAARSSTAGVYDASSKSLVIFGGNTSTNGAAFSPLNDLWSLDLGSGAWKQISTTGAPAARLFHTAAIDPASHRLYVFAGGDANAFTGPFLSDLWSVDLAGGAWTQEAMPASGPAGRINPVSVFDTVGSRLVIFGGHDDGDVGNNNDTWAFDTKGKTWSKIVPPETVKTMPVGACTFPPDFTTPNLMAPDRRSSTLAVLDSARASWTIFGGATDCGLIDDVWSFDIGKGSWSNVLKARVGEACLRGANPSQCTTLCQ
jgi:hypothetical protein